jgi:hypothetical protein
MYLKSLINDEGEITFPSIKHFVSLLLDYFQPINQAADAVHQFMMLKQGKKTAEEVITELKKLSLNSDFLQHKPDTRTKLHLTLSTLGNCKTS